MTDTTTQTREEPKVCAQTFASLASLGILVHFGHEMVTLAGDLPAAQVVAGVVVVATTLGLAAAWYRMPPTPRRILAVVLGALWAVAASEHLLNLGGSGSALDLTGVLAFAGGLTWAFAAYWDRRTLRERSL